MHAGKLEGHTQADVKSGGTYGANNCHGTVFKRNCCVQDYYVYKEVWEAAVREVLVCERVSKNAFDQYTVAVKKEGTIIGHVP